MRLLTAILLLALLVPSCRHRKAIAHEGCFLAGGCHFIPQEAHSHKLCRGDAKGELIGRVRTTGVRIRVKPVRQGKYSRYALELFADGGAHGKATLSARGEVQNAVVHKDGSVDSLQEVPETLPQDWVALVSLDGNICLVAWNRKNGGYNPKFYAKNTEYGVAVYKVLEMDDPRYHTEGFPLREIRED